MFDDEIILKTILNCFRLTCFENVLDPWPYSTPQRGQKIARTVWLVLPGIELLGIRGVQQSVGAQNSSGPGVRVGAVSSSGCMEKIQVFWPWREQNMLL